jgi:two-component system, OmpR family, alkaline phosphatase synthesis response regulator PhoP
VSQQTILVVEDDPAIRRGLVDCLSFSGYRVLETGEGQEALRMILGNALDLVLLDVMIPGMSGLEILPELRRSKPSLPVIMVTARGSEEDRVLGLRGGADDYVVKPFSSTELLARVEAVLRRCAERPDAVGHLFSDGIAVHLERREVIRASGESEVLSERETEILAYLAACRGRAVARKELLQRVWGLDPRGIETRTVDMHIARLREKLGDASSDARFVVTVRSKGYMLGESVEFEV